MDYQLEGLFEKLDQYLEEDLNRFKIYKLSGAKSKKSPKKSKHHNEFVKYLVSVATHPICLRASIRPFDCNQEQMLSYIMSIFSLNETKLQKILTKSSQRQYDEVLNLGKESMNFKKRHSWRPELRIRINAPSFFYKKQTYLDNLHVRIYLFKDDRFSNDSKTLDDTSDTKNVKAKGILDKIFKGLKLDSAVLIRPVNEMRCLVRFESTNEGSNEPKVRLSKFTHKMVQVLDNSRRIQDDIYLHIRRYYCEPNNVHILRFEFWLDNDDTLTGSDYLKNYRQYVRKLVYNGCADCFRSKKTTYMNESQEFYGYINLKLTQLPSYATKQNYPILSLQDRIVNNCEICIEPRNRRIFEEGDGSVNAVDDKPRKSSEEFFVNHIRLYANCLMYQSLSLNFPSFDKLYEPFDDITLDNLLYLPAYALLNQHRLQSNFNRYEDQSIRRVSILILLIKLEQRDIEEAPKLRLQSIKSMLISILRNEYIVGFRMIDEKTMQEFDPFQKNQMESVRSLFLDIELVTLREFVNNFLLQRLKRWLVSFEDGKSNDHLEREITLFGLKLFKVAYSHFKKLDAHTLHDEIVGLRNKIERIICEIIIDYLKSRIEGMFSTKKSVRFYQKDIRQRSKPDNVLVELLHSLKRIDHDLNLYWSSKGIDGCITNQRKFVQNLHLFETLDRQNLWGIIESRINEYLVK